MISITALIRVRPGTEAVMRDALLRVAEHVRMNEPRTVSFFVSAGASVPNLFLTYERFVDRAAMEIHNASSVVADVHRIAKDVLEEPIVLEIGEEIWPSE